MGQYRPAAVCRRGHVATGDATNRELVTARCEKCGAQVLTACPNCEKPIRGRYIVPGVIDLVTEYSAPDFCADCGSPFPWASRQARIYELMNVLDAEQLDPATELTVREQLEALSDPDLEEEDERRGWERVKKLAPSLWSAAQPILTTVISAEVKRQLGLP